MISLKLHWPTSLFISKITYLTQTKRTQDLIFAFYGTGLVLLFVFKSKANAGTMKLYGVTARPTPIVTFKCFLFVCVSARQFKEFQTKSEDLTLILQLQILQRPYIQQENIKSFSVDMKITLLRPFGNTTP